jgi:hypothetical protein
VTTGCAFDSAATPALELPSNVDVATALAWDEDTDDFAARDVPDWLRGARVETRAASIPAGVDTVARGDHLVARIGPLRVYYDDDSGETTEATLIGEDLPETARLVVGSWSGDPLLDEPIVIDGRDAWLLSPWNDEFYHLPAEPALGAASSTDLEALDATVLVRRLQTCPTSFRTCVVYGAHDAVLAAEDPAAPNNLWVVDLDSPPPLVADRELTEDVRVSGDERVSVRGTWSEDGSGPSILRITVHHERGDVHVTDVRSDYGADTLVVAQVTRVDGAHLVTAFLVDEGRFVIATYDSATGEPLEEARTLRPRIYEDWIAEMGCGGPAAQPVPVIEAGALRGIALFLDQSAIWFEAPGGRSSLVSTPYDGEYPSLDALPPFFELGVDMNESEPVWPADEGR